MKNKKKITRSLCAVMLILCCLTVQWDLASGASSQEEADVDVYAIDIEFGNLSFYYDFGIWEPNAMRYVADEASKNPAIGTEDGFPGWYGFDGIANRIKVKNSSSGGRSVTLSLTYRSLTTSETPAAGVSDVVTGVTMVVDGWSDGNRVTVPVDENGVIGYIHLQGEPTVGTDRYSSSVMVPIGMLTITIESWE